MVLAPLIGEDHYNLSLRVSGFVAHDIMYEKTQFFVHDLCS